MNQETQDTENTTKKLKRWEESRVDNHETQDTENSTKKLKRWEETRVDNQETQDTENTTKKLKKMGGIQSGQPRDTRHGKLNKETKKMR